MFALHLPKPPSCFCRCPRKSQVAFKQKRRENQAVVKVRWHPNRLKMERRQKVTRTRILTSKPALVQFYQEAIVKGEVASFRVMVKTVTRGARSVYTNSMVIFIRSNIVKCTRYNMPEEHVLIFY